MAAFFCLPFASSFPLSYVSTSIPTIVVLSFLRSCLPLPSFPLLYPPPTPTIDTLGALFSPFYSLLYSQQPTTINHSATSLPSLLPSPFFPQSAYNYRCHAATLPPYYFFNNYLYPQYLCSKHLVSFRKAPR